MIIVVLIVIYPVDCVIYLLNNLGQLSVRGAYHLTEKSGWGVESIMVSDLPVYRRNATSVTV